MPTEPSLLRRHARTIWDAAVAAVRADDLVANTLADVRGPLHRALAGPGAFWWSGPARLGPP